MSSPTSRTLKRLREQGYTADVVERWIPRARVRKDFLGILDIISVGRGKICGIQTTDGSNMSKRVKKLMGHENSRVWLSVPNTVLQAWGWRKLAKTGRWEPRIINFCIKNNILVARTQKT